MSIHEVLTARDWQRFVVQSEANTFLQSLNWQKMQQAMGRRTWRLGLYNEEEKLISVALSVKVRAKRGDFLLVPHGPIFSSKLGDYEKEKALGEWTESLRELARQEKCAFVRVQPVVENESFYWGIFQKLGYRPAPMHVHTETTRVLDITPEVDTILQNMRKTTRQMVRKGEKMVKQGELKVTEPKEISQEMLKVYRETYQRGGANPYSDEYLRQEWECFAPKENAKLFVVWHEDRLLSWVMVVRSGKRAFYHQGGNILDKRFPASYLAQWRAIKWAKEQGCISYDFWGVSPQGASKDHPWQSISMFKRGFGGEYVEHLPAQDWPVSPKYWLNWVVEKVRAKRRGFE
jgi:lipid II:glycine glycyltransferase (peptidoglycan interpeptide bridge formation enzyme)